MNMNVSLTEELANFVKAKVSAGRYTSSSEVVREALRLMEKIERQEAEKLSYLRQAWRQGIDSGDCWREARTARRDASTAATLARWLHGSETGGSRASRRVQSLSE